MPAPSRPPAYERQPYATQLDAVVLRVGLEGGRPFAVLDDTPLYPEGGGQPADRGFLGDVAVVDVQRRADEIWHFLAAPVADRPVSVRLDWVRRFDHMQQHTGQHLLSALAQDRFGWPTTAFHLGQTVSDVELAVPRLEAGDVERLEEALAVEIRSARAVTCRRVSPADFARLTVRTRGLPEGHTGDIRLVEIAGVDLNTCGGTHVQCTAEIETLKLLDTESLRGGTRLFFVAGGRVRLRLGHHERRSARLRALLGVPDEDLPSALESRLEQQRALERRGRDLEGSLAAALAEALARQPERLVERHLEGEDAAFLQHTGRAVADAAPDKLVFLTATHAGQSFFVLVGGGAVALDIGALGRDLAALLGARGGGAGRLFQGKTPTLEARAAALDCLRATIARS